MKKIITGLLIAAMLTQTIPVIAATNKAVTPTDMITVGNIQYQIADLSYDIIDVDGNIRQHGDFINSYFHTRASFNELRGTILKNGEKLAIYPKGTDGFFLLEGVDNEFGWGFDYNEKLVRYYRSRFILNYNEENGTETNVLIQDTREWYQVFLYKANKTGFYKAYVQNTCSEPLVFSGATFYSY